MTRPERRHLLPADPLPADPLAGFGGFEAIYEAVLAGGPRAREAEALLGFRHWHARLSLTDPRSGEALTRSLREVLRAEAEVSETSPQDLLLRIVSHVEEAVRRICVEMRTNVRREHEVMPIHAAREFDGASILWLSRKSGRSLREKLGDSQKILAVRRRMSVDVSENRLFKACMRRLEDLLRLRIAAFPAGSGGAARLLETVDQWRIGEEAAEIGLWSNPPPNNVLLQDRRYRKIWDAWVWLQTLDDAALRDQRRRLEHWTAMLHWRILLRLSALPEFRLLEQPCLFDQERLSIRPALGEILGVFAPAAEEPDGTPFRMRIGEAESALEIALGARSLLLEAAWADPAAGRLRLSLKDAALEEETQEVFCGPVEADLVAAWMAERLRPGALPLRPRPPSARPGPPPRLAVLDFSMIRPVHETDQGPGVSSFDLLTEFWPLRDEPDFPVDPGAPEALDLKGGREIVSLLSLTRAADKASERASDRARDLAARRFAARIRSDLGCEQVVYIVPDATDDFSLSHLRQGMNAQFRRAEPLPRSVARLFLWLAEEEAGKDLQAGDSVLVFDLAGDAAALTHLKAREERSGGLRARLPRSGGLFWEKHPTLSLGASASSGDLARAVLEEDGCPDPERAAKLLGLEGVRRLGPALSWRTADGGWRHGSEKAASASPAPDETRMRAALARALQDLGRKGEGFSGATRLLLTGEARDLDPGRFAAVVETIRTAVPLVDVRLSADLAQGGFFLQKMQEQAGEFPLWREHLPELSIRILRDGCFSRLHLVDQTTITPRRGLRTDIPIAETFTLPAGRKSFRFPLRKGGGGDGLNYQAVLESPAFPLERDLQVELRLSFTYGADNPYELVFHALAGERPPPDFLPVSARWQPPEAGAQTGAPGYPKRRAWAELRRFPKPGETRTNDLPRELRKVHAERLLKLEHLSDQEWQTQRKLFQGWTRFLTLTIWGQGRSLSDPEAPEEFGSFIRRTLPDVFRVYLALREEGRTRKAAEEMAREIFLFLCAIHADASPEVQRHVCERFAAEADDTPEDWRHFILFAYAVGEGRAPWQKEMLATAIRTATSSARKRSRTYNLRLLAVSLWRTEPVVWRLSAEDLSGVLTSLTEQAERMAHRMSSRKVASSAYWQWGEALVHFSELLLGLLRLRSSPDPEIAALLAPDSEHVRRLTPLMELLSEQAVEAKLKMKSRLDLQMTKPEALRNMPDILYALHAYLTGDAAADAISIADVTDS